MLVGTRGDIRWDLLFHLWTEFYYYWTQNIVHIFPPYFWTLISLLDVSTCSENLCLGSMREEESFTSTFTEVVNSLRCVLYSSSVLICWSLSKSVGRHDRRQKFLWTTNLYRNPLPPLWDKVVYCILTLIGRVGKEGSPKVVLVRKVNPEDRTRC